MYNNIILDDVQIPIFLTLFENMDIFMLSFLREEIFLRSQTHYKQII